MSAFLRNDFSSRAPISQVPASWFNSVANFINGLIPGDGIRFTKNINGGATVIESVAGEGTVTSVDGVGPDDSGNVNLDNASDPPVRESDIGETVAAKEHTHSQYALDTDLDTVSNAVETILDDYLTSTDIGTTVAAKDHNHAIGDVTGLQTALDGKAPSSTVSFPGFGTGANEAARGNHWHGKITSTGGLDALYAANSLLAMDSSGQISAASFQSEATPHVTAENVKKALSCFNLETAGDQTIKGDTVKLDTPSVVVETDANGNLVASEKEYAELTDTPPEEIGEEASAGTSDEAARADHVHAMPAFAADSILGTDADGLMTEIGDILTTAPTTDKVLTVKKNGTEITWENGGISMGEKTSPSATKGISIHGEYPTLADFYDYPDKAEHTSDPAIVYPAWQARLDLPNADGAEHVPPSRMTGADNTTPVGWERGKTAYKNGHEVDATHPSVGCSMTVCTHMRQTTISGSMKYQAIFSRMEFDENGLLVRVVPCSNWYTLM